MSADLVRPPLAPPTYPDDLPIVERRQELLAAIRDRQVVVVAGETGSGKSTQLPKLCLELGRGTRGRIGHTQPRRIAARAVAERVAEELGSEVGELVGYTVRFTDRVGGGTYVKVMTDGILLAELQRDRLLQAYDTIIVDEAHERSLNVDFLLGYLRQLLPRRPDLKVIITSATIDTERFSEHFGGAPVIEVSGRTYPVEVRYRPVGVDPDDDRDQIQAICDAVEELTGEGPGDILVFLSGEREIRDTAEALDRLDLRSTEVVPLFARLSADEQHRVFKPHRGRRIVCATNVAETSLTVPGIRYVVDPGTARISRYNRRTKVQRLPIEAISQASAAQRAGRCGRIGSGICIRLYGEDDHDARPAFTDPEVLRTNLASVILRMAAIGLGDVAAFPFVDPPDARSIDDGVALLRELGALDGDRLTPLGRKLANLPIDPRLGRMVLEADRNGCAADVVVIAAALSIQDPRERPVGKEQGADALHARFTDRDSDFITYLNLWRYLREQQRSLGSSAFRRLCKSEHLHHLRVREWQDLHGQLRAIARVPKGEHASAEPDRDRIHQSLLAGLLSHVGTWDPQKREYVGARQARFAIGKRSALARSKARWVMAGELVETNRLWAHTVARIKPEWIERLAGHLVKRSHGDPWWDEQRASAVTNERVTLYGLPIVASRRTQYSRVDPAGARRIFLQRALVDGEWDVQHDVLAHNRELVDKVRASDAVLLDLYEARVPADVTTGRHFERWWREAKAREPDLLTLTLDTESSGLDPTAFPDDWDGLPLRYLFDPGDVLDGVTVDIPVAELRNVDAAAFEWQVPGLRQELVTALIRSLPKPVRRSFVPAPDFAAAVLDRAGPGDGPLLEVLTRELTRMTGDAIPPGSWDWGAVPDHLRVTFRAVDERGRPLAWSKDLGALRQRLRDRLPPTPDEERRNERDQLAESLPVPSSKLPRPVVEDAVRAVVDHLLAVHGDEEVVRREAAAVVRETLRQVGEIITAAGDVERRLDDLVAAPLQPAVADVRAHLDRLLAPGFVTDAGIERLPDILRYVRAAGRRLDKLVADPARDRRLMVQVHALEDHPRAALARWPLEELRVSLFAQALGTAGPVSEQRIRRLLAG